MDRVLINPAIVSEVADAVRIKKEKTEKMKVSQLPAEILSIETASDVYGQLVDILGDKPANDIELSNAIAMGATDTPIEQRWNETRPTAGGATIKDGVAFMKNVKGESLKIVQTLLIDRWVGFRPAKITLSITNNTINVVSNIDTIGGDDVAISNSLSVPSQTGHKYISLLDFSSSNNTLVPLIEYGYARYEMAHMGGNLWYKIHTATSAQRPLLKAGGSKLAGDEWSFSNIMCFDLTAMGMEDVTTADEFVQRLGYASIGELPYIPYTEGEIVPMKAESIVSRGRNLWDEEWENAYFPNGIKVVQRQSIGSKNLIPVKDVVRLCLYSKSAAQLFVNYYDKDGNFIPNLPVYSDGGRQCLILVNHIAYINIPSGVEYMRFSLYSGTYDYTPYRYDTCLSIPDSMDGTYTPYREPVTYPFNLSDIVDADGNQLFPNGLNGIGEDYGTGYVYVGDEISDKAYKRVGVVNLGNLNWDANDGRFYSPFDMPRYPNANGYRCLCVNFVRRNGNEIWNKNVEGISVCPSAVSSTPRLYVYDSRYSNMSTSEFKAAMQGVLLYYELAEPVIVDIAPRKAFYKVQNGGTEELVAEGFTAPLNAEIGYKYEVDIQDITEANNLI